MKHLKTFERFNSEELKNIDDILDKINQSGEDSLDDDEIQTLKNDGVRPNWKSKLKGSLDFRKNIKVDYKDDLLGVDEMTPKYLIDILDDIEKEEYVDVMTSRAKTLLDNFPNIKTDDNLKDIWDDFIKNKWHTRLKKAEK